MASIRPETPQGNATLGSGESFSSKQVGDMEKSAETAAKESPSTSNEQSNEAPNKVTTALVICSVLLSMFLVALDRTIVSTAIPVISNEFNSLSDVGWYGSAYLLTCCAFQLLFGKVYTFFPVKTVLLANILLFEVASVICGAAPNSAAFIVGRAISGVGAAGLFAGTIVCTVQVVPLHQRPKIQGLFGALFGLASIIGPIVGGAFTSHVTWRWCFYINLPIGGVAMAVIAFFLKLPDPDTTKLPLAKKLVQLDLLGTAVLVPGVVCLLLALQWGGTTYAWSDGRIIALLTLTGVLVVAYCLVQVFTSTATLPPRLVKQRNVVSAFWATLTINCGMYIYVYFLPIWFQAVLGVSPVDSGIRLLPVMLSMVVGSIFSGALNSKIGYYTPVGIVGSCIMIVGAGLLTTFQVDTGSGKWIGYQVLYGFGMGSCFQVPNLAVQTALPPQDVPVGLALMFFGSLIGSTVFVSVGENVLSNQLVKRMTGLPGFDVQLVTSGGATALLDSIAPNARGAALVAYNAALRDVFLVGLIVTCLAVLGTFTLEWLSVKKDKPASPAEPSGGAEEKKVGETAN
ncbi:major facilitator superfamily domain-containing protein [Achaetomium macrosporum]|uniref:Major facilitator superfamily domain-containing protein n=1 Tax=Achaetomium macrosporum TaxID=79813 RepID=A0AAN7H7M9_9PEZI|nr:major facilitator superfamily domain-containing protein [Achaetomium macrosporum]